MDVKVKQKEGEEIIPVEVLAQDIRRLNKAALTFLNSGLREETIVLLLNDCSGVGKPAIRAILKALPTLAEKYTK